MLPPSSTGARGAISARSLRLYAAVRALGVPLVVISGCRAATLLQRLPCLPAADAYVCESGGRIFYPSKAFPTAAPLEEDLEWRRSLEAATGPAAQAGPPAERRGALWACFARLQAAGFACDAASYTTAFRLRGALAEVRSLLSPELAAAENLKHVDVYPAASGKRNAALHLMRRFGADPAAAAFLCDDDNDVSSPACRPFARRAPPVPLRPPTAPPRAPRPLADGARGRGRLGLPSVGHRAERARRR
jgi:hypothetical protein